MKERWGSISTTEIGGPCAIEPMKPLQLQDASSITFMDPGSCAASWLSCPLCFSLLVSFLKKLTPPRHYDTYRHTPCDTICVTSLTWEPKNSAFRNRNNTPETSAASKSQAPSLQTSGRAPRLRTTEKCSHRCPQATWEPVPESESLCAIEHKTD